MERVVIACFLTDTASSCVILPTATTSSILIIILLLVVHLAIAYERILMVYVWIKNRKVYQKDINLVHFSIY